MTRQQAIEIERRRVNGLPVTTDELDAAERVLNRDAAHRTPKFRLPLLSREVQSRADAVLCFNLGRAIWRSA